MAWQVREIKRSHLYGMLGTAVLLSSGCSSGKPGYDYAIPPQICGIGVDRSALKPIIPPGKEGKAIEVGANDSEHQTCWVVIDKKRELGISILRDNGVDNSAEYWEQEFKNFRRISLNGVATSAGVADDGAAAMMKCQPKPGQPQEEMPNFPYTHLRLKIEVGDGAKNPEDVTDRRAGMERFMRSYIPELTKAWCR
ncbi:hypothetical protein [Streptomyces sp. NPDC059018]|uniref:hypothetical protein n=1 Tax=Streptomyces sp. NPDC059018 TaxID=3346701 RepID=UPI0036A4B69C